MRRSKNVIDVESSRNQVTDEKSKALNEILTQGEAAKYLRVSQTTLVTWGKQGVIKPIRVVGRVYYLVSDIKSLFKEKEGGANNG